MPYRYINLKLNGSVALVTLKGDDASNRVNAQMCEDLDAVVNLLWMGEAFGWWW